MSLKGSGYEYDSITPLWSRKGKSFIIQTVESIIQQDNCFCLLVNLFPVLELVILLQLFLNG